MPQDDTTPRILRDIQRELADMRDDRTVMSNLKLRCCPVKDDPSEWLESIPRAGDF